jgi:hypothetical protein
LPIINNGVTQNYVGFQINTDGQAYFPGKVNALGGLEVRGDFNAPNNAYITTLQVNQWSYLKNTVIDGSLTFNNADINILFQRRWVSGSVGFNGSIIFDNGRAPFTVIKSMAEAQKGVYQIRWLDNPLPSPNYTVYITLVGVFGFSTFLNNTITSVDIYTANASGVYTNIGFVFSVFV